MSALVDTDLRRTVWRIGVQTALLLMVSLVVVGAVVYATVLRSQNALVVQTLDQAMSQALTSGDVDHDFDSGQPAAGVRTAVLTDGGIRLGANRAPGLPDRVVMEQVRADGRSDRRTVNVSSGRYALLTERHGDQVTQVMYPLFEQHQERERILGALGLAGGVGLLLSTLLGAWLARRAVRPMAEALILQRRFVADAGHELRTPLTLLSTRAQLLRRRLTGQRVASDHEVARDLDELLARDVDEMVADTQTLAGILEELLMAADTRTPVLDEPVDLRSLVSEAVSAAQASAQQRGIALVFSSDDPLPMTTGTPAALTRAVTALVDNAVSHATTRVEVNLRRGRSGISISVSDDGPGIAESVLPRMFERFASERNRQDDPGGQRHYGLGLALVTEIVTRHGGGVVAANRAVPDHGAVLTITVPAAKPSPTDHGRNMAS